MRTSDQEKLRSYFLESSLEILAANGIPTTEDGAPERYGEWVVAADIGFSGDSLRGTLTTIIPVALLRSSYPARFGSEDAPDSDAVDWAGEFTNQLLGRLKNKLLIHGVVLSASTPLALLAESVKLGHATKGTLVSAGFSCGEASVSMWLDVLPVDERELLAAPTCAGGAVEGEVVLFD